ncbi:MAG: lysophospholipid acyltransferase family protein [Alphaproteobacteria bacterium]
MSDASSDPGATGRSPAARATSELVGATGPGGVSAPRRHKRAKSPTRARVEYQGLSALLAWLHSVPLERAARRMAAIVGAGYWLSPRLRRIGEENLRLAFPERDEAWRRETLREVFRNLGRMAAEVAWFDDLRPGNVRERVHFCSDADEHAWREYAASGRPGILVSGHFGNWELLAQAAGLIGTPIHIVHRPLRNPLLDDLLNRVRSRAGTDVIYKHAAAREILRLLQAGETVAIPIDQHATGGQGVPVPFFGRPAKTTLGPARFAARQKIPLLLAVLVRRGSSLQHDVHLAPLIDPPTGRDEAALVETMTRVNLAFEEVVRAHPEQWLWVHRRWRA